MGNQQNQGGSQQGQQKAHTPNQSPKQGNKGGNDQLQQRSNDSGGDMNTGSSRSDEHGSTRSYGNDQERAGESGRKSHD